MTFKSGKFSWQGGRSDTAAARTAFVLEGDRYAVRYRECSILEAACVRRRLDRIEKLLEG